MPGFKPFKVRIRDTNKLIFEGEVDRLTSYNEVGPFDIYPMHANFISIIRKSVTLYLNHKIVQDLKFTYAVIKVKRDVVSVYLGIEELMFEEKTTSQQIAAA